MLYIVAEENNGETSCGPVVILSSEWLTPKKSEAYWPNTKNNTTFNKFLQKHETPGDDWALIKIKRKFFESDDILLARKKAREAENTSDLTDGELNDSSKRNKRKRIYSSSDDDDEDVFLHRRQVNQQKRNIFCNPGDVTDNRIEEYIPSEKNLHPSSSSTLTNRDVTDNRIEEYIPSEKNLHPSSSSTLTNKTSEINRILESPQTPASSRNQTLTGSKTNFEYSTMQMLISIHEQNKLILEWIRQQNQKEFASKNTLLELPVNFPLNNDEDLQAIEEFLALDKNFGDLCDYFGAFASHTVTGTVNQILKHCLSNKLAMKYSYKGKKGKRPFEDLNIKTVIIRATKKIFKLVQEKPIEDNVKVWLKHAPQRMNLEQKKIKARLESTV